MSQFKLLIANAKSTQFFPPLKLKICMLSKTPPTVTHTKQVYLWHKTKLLIDLKIKYLPILSFKKI